MAAPNTPQKAMPAISKGSSIKFLWTANKCYALSLPLSGTASPAGPLALIIMKVCFIFLLLFINCTCNAQKNNVCDIIYESPEIPAQFGGNTDEELISYFQTVLLPILGSCSKSEELISSLRIDFTIDRTGKIIMVEFPRLKGHENCKLKLRSKILTMPNWVAAKNKGKYVCSSITVPISCINWEIE